MHDIGSKANHAQATQSRDVIPFVCSIDKLMTATVSAYNLISLTHKNTVTYRNPVVGLMEKYQYHLV